jgi:hypothetical protein
MRTSALLFAAMTIASFDSSPTAAAESDSAMSRMRPIGSTSAIDQFRREDSRPGAANRSELPQSETLRTNAVPPVRQTAWMMQSGFDLPDLGGTGMPVQPGPTNSVLPTPIPSDSLPLAAPSLPPSAPFQPGPPVAPSNPQRTLPPPPITASGPSVLGIVPSRSDQIPIPQPQLNTNAFANVDNCHLVTGPSGYNSNFDCGCGQVQPTSYAGPSVPESGFTPGSLPTEIPSAATVAPMTAPPIAPTTPIATQPATVPVATAPAPTAPARAVISMGQDKYPVKVGQGLWGQPVAYVPGQRCRNWLRYLSF